jgi:hypothetical protein
MYLFIYLFLSQHFSAQAGNHVVFRKEYSVGEWLHIVA